MIAPDRLRAAQHRAAERVIYAPVILDEATERAARRELEETMRCLRDGIPYVPLCMRTVV